MSRCGRGDEQGSRAASFGFCHTTRYPSDACFRLAASHAARGTDHAELAGACSSALIVTARRARCRKEGTFWRTCEHGDLSYRPAPGVSCSLRGEMLLRPALAVFALCLTMVACSPSEHASPDPWATRRVLPGESRVPGPIAEPEWEREITSTIGFTSPALALRAGHGIVTLLQDAPLAKWMFTLADSGRVSAGGSIGRSEPFVPGRPRMGQPSDIVAVDEDGASWFLEPGTGRIVRQDVGGYRHLVGRLRAEGEVRTACALNGRVVFLDSGRPTEVLIQSLDPPFVTRALRGATHLMNGTDAERAQLRFGGSATGVCVLHSPYLPGVLLVSDSAVVALGPFIEPTGTVRGKEDRSRAPFASGFGVGRGPHVVGALDATSFPGGVAVLFEGRSQDAGRVIDLYAEAGPYLGTIRLPHRARRIAGIGHRIIVLSTRNDRSYLASYVLPPQARSARFGGEPSVPAPRPPAGSSALPADSVAASSTRPILTPQ